MSYPSDKFSVSMMPGESARLLEVEGKQHEECRWALKEISPAPGYVAAVAAEERGRQGIIVRQKNVENRLATCDAERRRSCP